MAFSLGPMEIIFLLVFGGGGQTGELVSFLPADQYFKSRNIETSIDNLVAVASKEPADGKTQIAQLLALRSLAERAADVKKAANYKDILKKIEMIARGDIAKDAQGFSRFHAERTYFALGAVALEFPKSDKVMKDLNWFPADLRKHTLNWFPTSATLVGGVDIGRPLVDSEVKVHRLFWTTMMKPKDWDKVFTVAEKIGNIRMDRLGFAYVEESKEIQFRVSGRANHARLVEGFKSLLPGNVFTFSTKKDDKDIVISTFHDKDGPSLMTFIGDVDFFFSTTAGPQRKQADKEEPLAQVLAIRAGKQANVLTGKLKEELEKVSDKACGLLVGNLPEDLRRNLTLGLGAAPRSIGAEIFREKLGLEFKVTGSFANAGDVKAFEESALKARQAGLKHLDNIPKGLPIPAGTISAIKKTLESIKLQPDGANLKGSLFMSADALRAIVFLAEEVHGEIRKIPPPEKIEFKKGKKVQQ